MSYTGVHWLDYANGADLYWKGIRLEMAKPSPDPKNKVAQTVVLRDGPGKGYGTVWG